MIPITKSQKIYCKTRSAKCKQYALKIVHILKCEELSKNHFVVYLRDFFKLCSLAKRKRKR